MIFLYTIIAFSSILFLYYCIRLFVVNREYQNIDYYSNEYNYQEEKNLKKEIKENKIKLVKTFFVIYLSIAFIIFIPKLIVDDFTYTPKTFLETFNSMAKTYNKSNLVLKKLNLQNDKNSNLYNIYYKFDEDMGIEGEISKDTNNINKLAVSFRVDGERDIEDFVAIMNIITRVSNNKLSDNEVTKIFQKLGFYDEQTVLTSFKECVYKDVKYSYGSFDNTDIIHFKIEKVYNTK